MGSFTHNANYCSEESTLPYERLHAMNKARALSIYDILAILAIARVIFPA